MWTEESELVSGCARAVNREVSRQRKIVINPRSVWNPKPTMSDAVRPPIIGITGGIAAGKSTAARLLAGHDGRVIDADLVVRELQRDPEVVTRMSQILGVGVRRADGSLDREAAARAMFADAAARRTVEEYLHPLARNEIERRLADALAEFKNSGRPDLVVLDVPLLFEGGLFKRCDQIVYIDADAATRTHRAGATRGWTGGEVARREAHQLDLESKRARAHWILNNSGGEDALASEAGALRARILQFAKGSQG